MFGLSTISSPAFALTTSLIIQGKKPSIPFMPKAPDQLKNTLKGLYSKFQLEDLYDKVESYLDEVKSEIQELELDPSHSRTEHERGGHGNYYQCDSFTSDDLNEAYDKKDSLNKLSNALLDLIS